MKTSQKIGIGAAAGIVGIGSLLGVAFAQADPTDGPSSSSSSSAGQHQWGRHHRGMDMGMIGDALANRLADKLGMDQATVADAIQAAREATRPADQGKGNQPTDADRAAHHEAFVQELASQLGKDQTTVSNALDEIRGDFQTQRKSNLQTRLDEAVSSGQLTQAEADAVMKATEAGVIGFGRGQR